MEVYKDYRRGGLGLKPQAERAKDAEAPSRLRSPESLLQQAFPT